jgi:D-cysteine desulfhydrase
MVIQPPPRFSLAQLPTPIEILPLSPSPDSGVTLFIKRDDLTGSILSGNKVRKLEFLFYDLLASKCDTVITCGGVQSNHCRAVAAICATAGVECHLVLKGKEPVSPDGNYFLSKLFGAKVTFISVKEYETGVDEVMRELAARLKSKGKRPYIIPEGGSDPLGAWGYIKALDEIKQQTESSGIKLSAIVTAVGSGGTYAGLYLGSKISGWDIDILGFAVCRESLFFQKRIFDICLTVQNELATDLKLDPQEIHIDDGFIGPGYAKIGPTETRFIRDIAAHSGIVLDPAYTSKALLGLFTWVSEGRYESGSNILFIHTGGQWGLLPTGKKLFQNK